MKKILSIVTASLFTLALAATAFAAEVTPAAPGVGSGTQKVESKQDVKTEKKVKKHHKKHSHKAKKAEKAEKPAAEMK